MNTQTSDEHRNVLHRNVLLTHVKNLLSGHEIQHSSEEGETGVIGISHL